MLKSVILTLVLAHLPIIQDPVFEDPIAINEEMKEFLAAYIEPGLSQMDRLETLVYVVFSRKTLGFEYQNHTRTAIETFRNKGGNCLSFTNMFVGMARHLDLDVSFREVEIPPSWSMRGRLVVLSRHINVSVRIGSKPYIVDLFPEINRVEIGGHPVSDERAFAHFYNNKSTEALSRGKYQLALAFSRKAIDYDDTAPFVWTNKGVAHSHMGQLAEAEKAYRKALKIDKNYLVAVSNLGKLLERKGHLLEAEKFLEKAEEFRDKNPYFHFSQGEQAMEIGEYSESIKHFEMALKRKKNEHNFHFALARAYARLGEMEQVFKNLEKARKFAPDERGRLRYNHKLEILLAGGFRQN